MTPSIWVNGELDDLESDLVGKKTRRSLPTTRLATELIVPPAQEIKEFFAIAEAANTSASLPSLLVDTYGFGRIIQDGLVF
ncbi:hypothetical protein ACJX0J_042368, partial [Zea mays]